MGDHYYPSFVHYVRRLPLTEHERILLSNLYPEHQLAFVDMTRGTTSYAHRAISFTLITIQQYNHAHPQQPFVDLGKPQREHIINAAFSDFMSDLQDEIDAMPIRQGAAIGGTVQSFYKRTMDHRTKKIVPYRSHL